MGKTKLRSRLDLSGCFPPAPDLAIVAAGGRRPGGGGGASSDIVMAIFCLEQEAGRVGMVGRVADVCCCSRWNGLR